MPVHAYAYVDLLACTSSCPSYVLQHHHSQNGQATRMTAIVMLPALVVLASQGHSTYAASFSDTSFFWCNGTTVACMEHATALIVADSGLIVADDKWFVFAEGEQGEQANGNRASSGPFQASKPHSKDILAQGPTNCQGNKSSAGASTTGQRYLCCCILFHRAAVAAAVVSHVLASFCVRN